MFTIGTIIEYSGHTGPVKFSCEYATVFTIGASPDKLREVNMVIYPHSYDRIVLRDGK